MNKLAINIGEYFNSPFGTSGGSTLGDLMSLVITGSLVLSGVIVLFMFIIGGIFIISGAGQQNPEKVAKGKQAATSAIIGFVVVFVAYWIVRIIEIITGYDFITAPGI
jgi:hypothetical protein